METTYVRVASGPVWRTCASALIAAPRPRHGRILPLTSPQRHLHHTAHYHDTTTPNPPPILNTPLALSEERVTRWCRRLRALQEKADTTIAAASISPHTRPNPADTFSAQGTTHSLSSAASAAAAGNNDDEQQQQQQPCAALLRLHEWVAMLPHAHDRMPAVMVERVWAVYDAILPSSMRWGRQVHDNFFCFIHLILTNDVDVSAVERVSAALQDGLQRYHAVREELTALERRRREVVFRLHHGVDDATQTSAPTLGDEDGSGGDAAAREGMLAARVAELNRQLMEAKQAMMKDCLQAHKAGAPLHYHWLRHTAGMESGVRRLMDFRNTLDYFQRLCRREIAARKAVVRDERQPPSDNSTGLCHTDTQQRQRQTQQPQQKQSELARWMEREREVSTVSSVCTLLFQDFFSTEYLVMEELTWSTTPPSLLQQIITADTVQPCLGGLADLQYRMQPTPHRHLYAFLHPAVVEEPLMAVQVALTVGIACSVDALLQRRTPLADVQCRCAAAALFRHGHSHYTPRETNQNGHHHSMYRESSSNMHSDNSYYDGMGHGERAEVDTAMFYSINSGQSSLRGLNLGNMLIKRAVREIKENLNAVRGVAGHGAIVQFSTLSPIPGYMRWLAAEVEKLRRHAAHLSSSSSSSSLLTAAPARFGEHRIFGEVADATDDGTTQAGAMPTPSWVEKNCWAPLRRAAIAYGRRHEVRFTPAAGVAGTWVESWVQLCDADSAGAPADCVHALTMEMLWRLWAAPTTARGVQDRWGGGIDDDPSAWWLDHDFTAEVERPLLRSVAHYLYVEKRRNRVLDAVGNFHIGNGATLYRLNFLANTTSQGSRESACVMVNYRYDLPHMAANAVDYEVDHTVSVTSTVTDLLKCDE